MKKIIVVLLCALSVMGCTKMEDIESQESSKSGRLKFSLEKESYQGALKIIETINSDVPNVAETDDTKAGWGLRFALDTSKYLLTISNKKGAVFYDGLYSERPDIIDVPAGEYVIKLRSGEFIEPSKDLPLFGEDKVVKAIADSTFSVKLASAQLTGGIRVKVTENFKKYFKGGFF